MVYEQFLPEQQRPDFGRGTMRRATATLAFVPEVLGLVDQFYTRHSCKR